MALVLTQNLTDDQYATLEFDGEIIAVVRLLSINAKAETVRLAYEAGSKIVIRRQKVREQKMGLLPPPIQL